MSQSREKDDDTDMAISYANRLPPASHSSQTLPSFRELLPPHLHEEIDSTTYYTSPRHQSQERPVSGHEMADPRSIPYATNAPPSKMGYGDPHREYAVSRSGEQHPSRHLPDQGHLQMRRGENPSPTAPRFAAARGPSPILPPIRDLQPGVNAPTKGYPDSRVPPRSDPFGAQDYRGGQPPVDPRADPYLAGRGPPMMHHPPSPYGHAMPYHGEGEPMHSQMMGHPQQANFGIMGDPIDPKTKRRRGNLPKPVTDILRAWFHEHLDHPYPSEEDKQMFMTRTGLSISQISNWFINARRRQLPALRNQMRSGTTDTDSQRQSPFSDIEPTSPQ
ncbi:Homeodomain [Penicillium riverlandense]|uniref:Homeodomain n=1 Tax=Penicillium riverlandense TaxID=1903569 RepID=UPI002547A4BD|nr:Homeodomain [Penicillium riverlandense]KAJ5832979.1 Homeodomain [Penicillium riverlandense]